MKEHYNMVYYNNRTIAKLSYAVVSCKHAQHALIHFIDSTV